MTIELLTDYKPAANIVFLKPGRVTLQEGKSLIGSSVLRNEIQCFKSRLQKYKARYSHFKKQPENGQIYRNI